MNSDPNLGRPLPHSSEAERAILGSILLGSATAGEVMNYLRESDFFLPLHRVIFRHMVLLREQGKPSDDTVILYESLQGSEDLEGAGGIAYLSQITDGLPRLSNTMHYAGIVKQKAELRTRAYLAEAIREKLLNTEGNVENVIREVAILSAPLREGIGQNRILKFRTGVEIDMATDGQGRVDRSRLCG